MRIPGEVTVKAAAQVVATNTIILALSSSISMIPLFNKFEDFFVNGMRYDADLKLFIGPVSKDTHFKVFQEYFGRMKDQILSWNTTGLMLAEMFSHDPGAEDFTKTNTKIGFYGNDGVCLFKYFIVRADPQRAYVWSVLLINFICFMLIAASYILVSIISIRSSKKVSGTGNDQQVRQRNGRMNRKISIIITTDFLCWVPFIIICMLHYLGLTDATPWYSIFSMVILPINSVINPLLYNEIIMNNLEMLLTMTSSKVATFSSKIRIKFSSQFQPGDQDELEMQQI